MTELPLVSVVVTALNGERHIAECVRSILGQSYGNLEVIVADDASEDATRVILKSFDDPRLTVLPEVDQRLGLHANWTRAIRAARGKYVKLVCHDDVLAPTCVSIQVEMLEKNPDAVVACGRRRIISDHGRVIQRARGLNRLTSPDGTQLLSAGTVAKTCVRAGTNLLGEPANVLIRRAHLPEPLFDARWSYAIDVEFYFRCLRYACVATDERVVCSFRVSHRQLSARLAKEQAAEMSRLFADLERRYPADLHPADVRFGALRARVLAFERRLLYRWLRLRAKVPVG